MTGIIRSLHGQKRCYVIHRIGYLSFNLDPGSNRAIHRVFSVTDVPQPKTYVSFLRHFDLIFDAAKRNGVNRKTPLTVITLHVVFNRITLQYGEL